MSSKRAIVIVIIAYFIALCPVFIIGHWFKNEPTSLLGPHGLKQAMYLVSCAIYATVVEYFFGKYLNRKMTKEIK